jgi:hypothetical protein
MKIRTQKAKGILRGIPALRGASFLGEMFNSYESPLLVSKKSQCRLPYGDPVFARPCPTNPRHGFVDSRVITSNKQLKQLLDEVKKEDPNGEIILSRYYPRVKYNAIYVGDGMLSVGPKNDGATGGNNSIGVPVAPYKFADKVYKASGLNKDESVYLEFIHTLDEWHVVQVRGGPKAETRSDFIPRTVKVNKIVKPNDNLLAWEKEVKTFKSETVVYGAGHTLTSHAAIHCVINNIPFITSFIPKVGQIIKKNNKQTKIDAKDFRRGVAAGVKICKKIYITNYGNVDIIKDYAIYALSVLHNWAYIKNSIHAGWILGSAAVIFSKICATLCHGEYNHRDFILNRNRNYIYAKTLHCGLKSIYDLPRICKSFYSEQWEPDYGGIKWATCAWYVCKMWNAICDIYNGSRENIEETKISTYINLMNKVINLAHNCGWWLDKIMEEKELDLFKDKSGLVLTSVSHILYQIYQQIKCQNILKRPPHKIQINNAPCDYHKTHGLRWAYAKTNHDISKLMFYIQDENKNHKIKDIYLNDTLYKRLEKKWDLDENEKFVFPIKNNQIHVLNDIKISTSYKVKNAK